MITSIGFFSLWYTFSFQHGYIFAATIKVKRMLFDLTNPYLIGYKMKYRYDLLICSDAGIRPSVAKMIVNLEQGIEEQARKK